MPQAKFSFSDDDQTPKRFQREQSFFNQPAATPPAKQPDAPLTGRRWTWCVGPEGGLTETEQATLTAANFHDVALTPTILRAETAALTGAAILCLRRPQPAF